MIILQHDWFEAFAQNESAWCTYKCKEKTVHGTVTKNHSKEFNISKSDREITVGFENTKTTFLSPCRRFDADSFTFRFLDVSPNESLFVKNGENKVEVFDVDRHEIRKEVQFISTPQLVRFFPSGKVLLVADYNQLKVVDIATGTVARTLIGHSGEINQTQFIGPGRNIVSFSSDGTCKLWEMSSAECIATILDGGSGPINSGLVVSGKKLYEKPEKFFGEGNEFCWIGTESGKLIGKELFGDGVFSEELDSAINAMCYSEGRLFVGTQKGTLYRVVTNDFQIFATKCLQLEGPISSMTAHNSKIFVGHCDGRVVAYSSDLEKENFELSCADCDPIPILQSRNKTIYTSSRDGLLRCYNC